jgi:hypothetical protein
MRETMLRIGHYLYRSFAWMGDAVMRHPNKVFYAFLLLTAVFFPLFGYFITACLLCSAYRRVYG